MAKPIWCLICGTYRSGSTTQYLMTRDLVEETGSGIGVGYEIEWKLKDYDRKPSEGKYIVAKVFKFLPETSRFGRAFLEENRLKAICTIRDPRDIAVSMKSREEARKPSGHMEGAWNFTSTVTENFPVWLGQLEKWIGLGPELTLVTKYEEMILNLFREVKRIAAHLGIEVSDEEAKEIANRYRIRNLIARKKEHRASGEREDPWLPSIPGVKFGTSGQWRSWLTPTEATLVEEHCRGFMEKWGYLDGPIS